MQDVASAYLRYKFIGCEFLTWLWYLIENQPETITNAEDQVVRLDIGNRLVLENRIGDGAETVTIKGDSAGLEEAYLALKKGAWVTELHFIYEEQDQQWQFNIKGESLDFRGFKTPDTARITTAEDWEGAIIEKVFLYEKAFVLIDRLFERFLQKRLAPEWEEKELSLLKKWVEHMPA